MKRILAALFCLWFATVCRDAGFRMASGSGPARMAGRSGAGVDPPLQLAWTAKLNGPPLGGPMLHGSTILQFTTAPSLFAFDRSTGKPRGRREYDDPLCAPPVVVDSLVILSQLGGKAKLRAYHAGTGKGLWSHRLTSCFSPAVQSDTVVANGADGTVWAFGLADGRLLWKAAVGERLRTAPVLVGDMALAGDDAGIVAVALNNGAILWRRQFGAGARSRPLTAETTAFVASGEGEIVALSLADGGITWRQRLDGLPTLGMARSGALLVVGSSDRGIYALDSGTGAIRWRFASKGVFKAAPAATNRTVYCAGSDRYLYALDIASGRVNWKYKLDGPATTPVLVGDDIVCVASENETLYGFAKR